MSELSAPSASMVLQLRVVLRGISPLIWRRLLVRCDATIADLHATLQLALGWTDEHLNRFVIQGREYGVAHIGGMSFGDDPRRVRLADFGFRPHVRFLYEYDFTDGWQHDVRVECLLPVEPRRTYPVCVGGRRGVPPEDCGGSWAFLELRQRYSMVTIARRLAHLLEEGVIRALARSRSTRALRWRRRRRATSPRRRPSRSGSRWRTSSASWSTATRGGRRTNPLRSVPAAGGDAPSSLQASGASAPSSS